MFTAQNVIIFLYQNFERNDRRKECSRVVRAALSMRTRSYKIQVFSIRGLDREARLCNNYLGCLLGLYGEELI